MANKKIKVALIVGGTSPERKVSNSSGLSIYKALTALGYETILVDPAYGENQPKDVETFFAEKDFAEISNENYVKALNMKLFDSIDLAFLALHGKWGEDGTLQSLLELKGIKYTGSKVLSSAITMDKAMSKIMFQHFSVKTPNWFLLKNSDDNYELMKSKISKFFDFINS